MSGFVVKEEVPTEVEEEDEVEAKKRRRREARAEYTRQRRELARIICAGEDVEGVGEEERRRIIEQEEKRKQKDRERMRVRSTERARKIRQLKRRLYAGEEVEGLGEEEKMRIIEMDQRRKEVNKLNSRKRYAEKRDEIREKHMEIAKRRRQMRRLEMTQEQKEEKRKKEYFMAQARLAELTREERERRMEVKRRRQSEWSKRRWEKKGEEEKRKANEKNKEWVRGLKGEKRRKHMEGVMRRTKEWQEKMKERDPEGYERRQIKVREYQKRLWETRDEEWKRRRFNQMKVYQQKRRLRRELEGMGEDKEEIERRVGELDKRLREELGIGPVLRKSGRDEDGEAGSGSVKTGNEVEQTSVPPNCGAEEEENFQEFCDYESLNEMEEPVVEEPVVEEPVMEEPVVEEPVVEEPVVEEPVVEEPVVEEPVVEEPMVEVTFPCKYCKGPAFLSENDLKEHLRGEHFKICWKCPKCMEVMISSKELSQHFKNKHKKSLVSLETEKEPVALTQTGFSGKVGFLCMRCPWQPEKGLKTIKVFKSWGELHSHVKRKHLKYYWPCEHCHLLKYSKESLTVHVKMCWKKPS